MPGHERQWQDYPPVARWEWDVGVNTQVIGFRCLDGWCEVGELGHDPETGPDLTGTMGGIAGLSGSPVLKVKGWYDEQRLSPTKSGWWKPGKGPLSVVGTIVPVPGLDQLDVKSFHHLAAYRVRQFECTIGGIRQRAALRPNDSGRQCHYDFVLYGRLGAQSTPHGWVQRHFRKAPTGREMCRGSYRLDHPLVGQDRPGRQNRPQILVHRPPTRARRRSVPGTARWRWLADDETTWGRCGGACCAGH